MSTLTVTNIKATGETASRAVSGVAAAWVNFNGTGTIAIRDSQGVSGLVDNGAGDYTVNFSNSMSDGNYSAVSQGGRGDGSVNSFVIAPIGSSPTVSAFRINTFNSSFSTSDGGFVYLATHGDLA